MFLSTCSFAAVPPHVFKRETSRNGTLRTLSISFKGEGQRARPLGAPKGPISRTRLRPILMTSLAFILGVVPLAAATGAGAEMRQSLGATDRPNLLRRGAAAFQQCVFAEREGLWPGSLTGLRAAATRRAPGREQTPDFTKFTGANFGHRK